MMVMIIQNTIAKLPSELKELKNLFPFNALLYSNFLLWHFQIIVLECNIFLENLILNILNENNFDDYFSERNNHGLFTIQTVKS
ncbi:MAG: hypothetical protein ACI840_000394 [Ulvibacter sp.]|jgi:hypothetical protein